MDTLLSRLDSAAEAGDISPEVLANVRLLLDRDPSLVNRLSVGELVDAKNWTELSNRFFRTLAFGTGGLRGKTIGAVVTCAEAGSPQPLGRPEHPCVGTNAMNEFNVARATRGLARYVKSHFARSGKAGRAAICLCHDTRHFSREFALLAARTITGMGLDAHLFEGPRSTPELSFAVRHLGAQAGVNITASHNPPEYNGYKVYFEDGCQVTEPHASAIIDEVNRPVNPREDEVPESDRGRVVSMGAEIDAAYMDRLATLPLDPDLIRRESGLKIVYTPLHGVGAVIIKPMLARLGFVCETVAEQEVPDGRFPTVKSPNPENAEALSMAIAQADRSGADLVIATDPDDDRMGVAARDHAGSMQLLTGNQIGSILAWYRTRKFFELGVLNDSNRARGVIIKTFVTTDLQKAIAEKSGLRCVETLTGFKYIGSKLGRYEREIPEELRPDYVHLSEEETRRLRLEHSSFYVFGGEESYGYSASDFVRDKDGNSAAVLIAEAAAYAKSQGTTLPGLLDRIFSEFGVYLERGESLTMDGARGAAQIQKLVSSYANRPPVEIAGSSVCAVRNFATEKIHDVEGELVPAESMLMVTLADRRRVAIRPSGTEPKIKYYLFASELPESGRVFTSEEVVAARARVHIALDQLWTALSEDAKTRLT